ncbi:hypothetical protein [Microbacterium sp. NIBRBAC000506063]|uniref:hypothetical protein n=1 Tax=Microbacterium sp. NIBRBAC000506063 TaxID=2734618 RepID=UPI001BB74C1A|nr:hypothetical protein [Microbacterium sp. NIBRBAC000506063]QTV80137.1 hypothetical protein KAE78_03435 [Microbacterium sp. NIBRBAC000506063]
MIELSEIQARTRLQTLARPRKARPFLLGIVGAPGSGKSTFADSLGAPVLPMDGYHLADELLDALDRRDRKGAPDTFDVAGLSAALRRLRAGEDIVVPRFDRGLEAAIAGAIPLPSSAPSSSSKATTSCPTPEAGNRSARSSTRSGISTSPMPCAAPVSSNAIAGMVAPATRRSAG